ncbi:heparinase II/III domain-containing protein [Streptomyces sp. NBC_00448]|uniref:heparinase II/III domain-containing protein n=1 Tax=Streptomyces sp. NBC_00448 TaxID=2903652 RepID=UPI002E1A1BD6
MDTAEVRGAWTVLAHQACALRLRHLAASDDAADRVSAARGLERYAALYAELTRPGEHSGAPDWMLRGRLFQQALTEAIWAVNIGHAAWSLAERGEDTGTGTGGAAVARLLTALAHSADAARERLVARGDERSNYTAWLNAAAAVCRGRRDGDLRGHPGLATHPDGWEWEGSTYYHLFVLRAYLLSLRGCDPARIAPDDRERLAAMAAALAGVAAPDGDLPELHDGPYRRAEALAELHEVCLLVHQLFTGEPLAEVLDRVRSRSAAPAPDVEGWFDGPALPWPYSRPRRTFPDAGFAVVRGGGVHAVLDAGPHGGGHGHQDKLALYLYGPDGVAWQPDPGQVPYAHRAFRAYYASTAAHPAFCVDGADQRQVDARLDRADERSAHGVCAQAYDGVTATRTVTAAAGYLLDVLTVEADRARTLTAHLRPAVEFDAVRGPDGVVRTVWGDEAGPVLTGSHVASAQAEFAVRPHPGPADDPAAVRQGADWSAHGRRVVFASAYCRGLSPVRAMRLDGSLLAVELLDGTTDHHDLGE